MDLAIQKRRENWLKDNSVLSQLLLISPFSLALTLILATTML